jgi:hypothetical protein
MSAYTVRFQVIPMTVRKSVKCSSCGKRIQRQRTFEQTVNPWNKNADGEPKTVQEILEEHRVRAAEWKQEPAKCSQCEEEAA